jgi:hypothetical protein
MEFEAANWVPLESRIGERCEEFMWMWRENGFEFYKNINTRRYLVLDGYGICYVRQDGMLEPTSFEREFRRVVEGANV